MLNNSGNILKAIIIDDEPMASDHLKATLLACNNLNVDICDIANSTTMALQQINACKVVERLLVAGFLHVEQQ